MLLTRVEYSLSHLRHFRAGFCHLGGSRRRARPRLHTRQAIKPVGVVARATFCEGYGRHTYRGVTVEIGKVSSILTPKISSPFGFSGQRSALVQYSAPPIPQSWH
jgi:hypothetical protein